MTKDADIADLLGSDDTAPKKATKAKADKPAKEPTAKVEKAPAAKKAVKKEATPAKEAAAPAKAKKAAPAEKAVTEKAPKTPKEPVTFEEGEREELIAKIKKAVKKDINSRELAAKLGVATRKLRPVLYSAERAGVITLTPGESRIAGMTVSPAA